MMNIFVDNLDGFFLSVVNDNFFYSVVRVIEELLDSISLLNFKLV